MCGISGYFSETPNKEHELCLNKSISKLTRRGPNSQQTKIASHKKSGLGHARLSIIDTSAQANQPMTTVDGRYSMVFNGEIYNYKSLRQQLLSKGYQFHTESDTEVLLNLYHLHKEECWKMLNGFFAVAIYDNHTQTLELARDRFGIKPLLYYYNDKTFYFASEMKALMEYPIEKKIDSDALHQYFSFNYIPTPFSIFQKVKKLAQGHYLKLSLNGVENKAYFELNDINKTNNNLDYKTAQKSLIELMSASVSDRLVADVPLGTFLSGGIDSSIITALASNERKGIDTFSIGFTDNKFFDETYYARLVAEKYQTNHHEIKLSNNDLLNSLDNLLDYTDEPFADSSALAVNLLCKETKKHVTVALSGDGADELFAGYNKYQAEFRIQNRGLKEKLVTQLYPLWKIAPKSRNSALTNTFRKLYKYASGTKLNKLDRYLAWCSISNHTSVSSLLTKQTSEDYENKLNSICKYVEQKNGITDILVNDTQLVLTNDMLTKVDLMSMNNSLEVRVPFLDHRVVAFAHSLPDSFKINKNHKKRIVQDAFKDMLPKELYNRPKHGFEVPMLDWLKNELNTKIRKEYLAKDFLIEQGLFNTDFIDKLLVKLHSPNPEDSHGMVWALIVFQSWYKKHLL